MKIVVCVKIVPNTSDVTYDKESGSIIRDNLDSIVNPADLTALEYAVRLKDAKICEELFVISMGVMAKSSLLKEAFALGADRVILLNDSRFAGADTLATVYTLKTAIEKIGGADIILCGRQSLDGDTGQVGPGLATAMDMPFITNAERIDGVKGGYLRAVRVCDYGRSLTEIPLPGLITVINNSGAVRLPSLMNVLKAKNKQIEVWNLDDIEADASLCGAKGSPTSMKSVESADFNVVTEILAGDVNESAKELALRLAALHPGICA